MRITRAVLAAAALALVVTGIVVIVTVRPSAWNVTALPRVGQSTPLAADARRVDASFVLVPHGGYDGQFYWAIAVDPLATGTVHRDVDKPTYRYGHPLLGWLGWLLSGDQAGAAAGALLALGLLSIAAAAALAARLGGLTASLFVACNPGLLYAATHALAEPLMVALTLGTLLAFASGRWRAAVLLCALLPLAKEQLVLVPLVLAGWALVRRERTPAVALLASLAPAIAWWVAMRIHLGAWFTTGDTALSAPFTGWKRSLLDNGVASAAGSDEGTLIALVAIGVLVAYGVVVALRRRGQLDWIYLALAAVVVCLAPNAVTSLRDAARNTALVLALLPHVLRRGDSERGSG